MSQLILTLNLTDELLQAAQEYARQHGQPLDALVAELLQTLVQPTQTTEPAPIRPTLTTIQELAGSLRAPADFDYKRELNEWRDEKFGG